MACTYLLQECVLSLSLKKNYTWWNRQVLEGREGYVLFLKYNEVVLELSPSLEQLCSDDCNKGGLTVSMFWRFGCDLLSGPNWGQVRRRQWQRLCLIEQRLTFCLMNHGNAKENDSNMQNGKMTCYKLYLPLSFHGQLFNLLRLFTISISSSGGKQLT